MIWTQAFRSTDIDADVVDRRSERIAERATEELREEGFAGEPEIVRAINMRYLGQNYEHEVEIAAAVDHRREACAQAFDRFDTPARGALRLPRSRARRSSWSASR